MSWTRTAAILGFLGVALGAFGAHGLEGVASPEELEWWHTATLYLLVHVAPLLALDALAEKGRPVALAGRALLAGELVFCGTLFAMGLGGPRWLGAITPFGGVAYLVGWAALAWAAGHDTAGRASRAQKSA